LWAEAGSYNAQWAKNFTVPSRLQFFLEHTTRDFVTGESVIIVRQISRLYQFIHDTPFGNLQREKIGFIDFWAGGQHIIYYFIGMKGIILA
jgi:hypothetical protein